MTEIKSDQREAQQLADELKAKSEALQETKKVMPAGSFSTVAPSEKMKEAFSNSLLYADQYTSLLQESIEKIVQTANAFSEQDHEIASGTKLIK
ncbi:TIGR04197 family type VII secretion effector [Listeria kieliensis]